MGPRACADALHRREGMGDRPFPRPNHTLPSKNLEPSSHSSDAKLPTICHLSCANPPLDVAQLMAPHHS